MKVTALSELPLARSVSLFWIRLFVFLYATRTLTGAVASIVRVYSPADRSAVRRKSLSALKVYGPVRLSAATRYTAISTRMPARMPISTLPLPASAFATFSRTNTSSAHAAAQPAISMISGSGEPVAVSPKPATDTAPAASATTAVCTSSRKKPMRRSLGASASISRHATTNTPSEPIENASR